MTTLADVRKNYPQYSDMSDADLASALHQKFYSDMPRAEFDKNVGLAESDPIKATAQKEYKERGPAYNPTQRLALQGITFNAADDILAGLNTPFEMAKRGTWNPVEGYKYAKAAEDVELDNARKNSGIGGTLAEIGGGVFSGAGIGNIVGRGLTAASSLLARSGAAAADAGILGAASGAMEGNSLSERAGNAVQGGLLSAGIGGIAPAAISAAGQALNPLISNIRARANPEGYARTQVARGLVESGRTPDDIALAVTQAANEGQPMFTVADAMGNAGQRMLATTARSPGVARTNVTEFLDARQAGQGRRVAGALAEGFDSPQTAAQTRESMTRARDAAANAEYGNVRADAGAVDLSPVIATLDNTLNPGGNIFRNNTNIANDSIEGALERVRNQLTDGRSTLTDFTTIQRVRSELSDSIESARRAGQNNRARMLGQVLTQLDNSMETASSGFRNANRNFAQRSADIEAIDTGRTAALRGRTEDTVPAFAALRPQGQAAYRAGYVDPLIESAQSGAFGVNKARPLINDAFTAESNAMAPGAPMMQRRIGREDTMFQTRNAAMGNSKTAENLNDDAAMGIDPGMIGQILSGNVGGALRSAMSAVSNGWNGNTAGVREQVANLLLQSGTNVSPRALQQMLDESVRRIELISNIARQMGRGASGGLAVTPSAASGRR